MDGKSIEELTDNFRLKTDERGGAWILFEIDGFDEKGRPFGRAVHLIDSNGLLQPWTFRTQSDAEWVLDSPLCVKYDRDRHAVGRLDADNLALYVELANFVEAPLV